MFVFLEDFPTNTKKGTWKHPSVEIRFFRKEAFRQQSDYADDTTKRKQYMGRTRWVTSWCIWPHWLENIGPGALPQSCLHQYLSKWVYYSSVHKNCFLCSPRCLDQGRYDRILVSKSYIIWCRYQEGKRTNSIPHHIHMFSPVNEELNTAHCFHFLQFIVDHSNR